MNTRLLPTASHSVVSLDTVSFRSSLFYILRLFVLLCLKIDNMHIFKIIPVMLFFDWYDCLFFLIHGLYSFVNIFYKALLKLFLEVCNFTFTTACSLTSLGLYQIWAAGREKGGIDIDIDIKGGIDFFFFFLPKLALSHEVHTRAVVIVTGYFLARLHILQRRNSNFLEFISVDLVPPESVTTKTIKGKLNTFGIYFFKS